MPKPFSILQVLLREWFSAFVWWVNSASAFLLSLFGQSSRERNQTSIAQDAWSGWWKSLGATSTFNDLLEREGHLSPTNAATITSNHSPFHRRATTPPPEAAEQRQNWLRKLFSLQRRKVDMQVEAATTLPPLIKQPPGQDNKLFNLPAGEYTRLMCDPLSCAVEAAPHTHTSLSSHPPQYPLHPGFAVSETSARSRGLLEDLRMASEVAVSGVFNSMRRALGAMLLLGPSAPAVAETNGNVARAPSATLPSRGSSNLSHQGSAAGGGAGEAWESLHVCTASDVILRAGYPLEEYAVETSDGYILQLQRIPRHGGSGGRPACASCGASGGKAREASGAWAAIRACKRAFDFLHNVYMIERCM